jgi:hypothetical protein
VQQRGGVVEKAWLETIANRPAQNMPNLCIFLRNILQRSDRRDHHKLVTSDCLKKYLTGDSSPPVVGESRTTSKGYHARYWCNRLHSAMCASREWGECLNFSELKGFSGNVPTRSGVNIEAASFLMP